MGLPAPCRTQEEALQNPTAARGSTSSSLRRLHRPGAARLESKAVTSLLQDLNDELCLFSLTLLVLFHP